MGMMLYVCVMGTHVLWAQDDLGVSFLLGLEGRDLFIECLVYLRVMCVYVWYMYSCFRHVYTAFQ